MNTDKDTAVRSELSGGEAVHNRHGEDIDWGSVDVYTCTNSCSSNSSGAGVDGAGPAVAVAVAGEEVYRREFVITQPPPPLRFA